MPTVEQKQWKIPVQRVPAPEQRSPRSRNAGTTPLVGTERSRSGNGQPSAANRPCLQTITGKSASVCGRWGC